MKKVLSFILVAMMVLSLTACGSKKVKTTEVDWTSYEAVMEFYNTHKFQPTNNPTTKTLECEDGVVDITVEGNEVTASIWVNGNNIFYGFSDGILVNINGEIIKDAENELNGGGTVDETGASSSSLSAINGIAIELPDGYSLAEEYCVGNGATEFVGRDADGNIIFDIGYSHGTAKEFGFETIEEVKAALSAQFEEMSADSSYEAMTVGNYEGCAVNSNGFAGLSDMANIALVSYENDEVTLYNILYDIDSKSIIDSFLQGLK